MTNCGIWKIEDLQKMKAEREQQEKEKLENEIYEQKVVLTAIRFLNNYCGGDVILTQPDIDEQLEGFKCKEDELNSVIQYFLQRDYAEWIPENKWSEVL